MKTTTKLIIAIICMAVFASFFSCTKQVDSPQLPIVSMKSQHGNNGHHFGNAIHSNDSASASQPNYEFPPLVSDTLRFPAPSFNTGFISYDSLNSVYTILSNGNYTVDVTCFRESVFNTEPTNLMLYVNGNLVFDNGFTQIGTAALQQSLSLNTGDVVYIRTQDYYHAVFPGGTFTISR